MIYIYYYLQRLSQIIESVAMFSEIGLLVKIVDKIEEITKEVGIFGGVPEIPTLFFDYVVGYSTII